MVRTNRNESIRSVENKSQTIAVSKVAASAEAGQRFDMCAVLREVACEFGEGEKVVGDRSTHLFNILQQRVIVF